MPQFFGRWVTNSAGGTRIELQVVPNAALLVIMLIVFSFLGILVYDQNWFRVVIVTSANAVLSALLLLIGFWVAVDGAERRLRSLLDAATVPVNAPSLFRYRLCWRSLRSWGLAALTLVIGSSFCWVIYTGRLVLSLRPAVDLVASAWATIGLMVIWLMTSSLFSPIARVKCLLMLFALLVSWSWLATVDGFAGDGRPIFAWRWLAKDTSIDSTSQLTRETDSTTGAVDLRLRSKDDFPGFRGVHRDGVISGVILDSDWDLHPPVTLWQQPIGIGWSSYAIAGGYAVTQEQRGPDEAVVCYEIATGRECWEHRDRARFHEMMGGDGPRATPTLDQGDVYSLGATGILNRLKGSDGQVVWTVNAITDSRAPTSLFGLTGSPLIVGDLVIINPGGPEASLVAYDKLTGKRRWAAGTSPTAYASPQLVRLAGQDQILTFNADGLFAHAIDDGRILWSYPWVTPPEFNNVCQPIVWHDPDGAETVFLSSGYGKGCVLLTIELKSGQFSVASRWQNKNLKVKFSSAVMRDGYAYGLDENILVCLDLRTGKRCWKGGRYGFGQLLIVDNTLLILSDYGEVILCEASPQQHRELVRMSVLNGRTWNHPALAGEILLIRNDRVAACLRLPFEAR